MFRKIFSLILVFITIFLVSFSLKAPVFKNYASEFEVYVNENSSLANIVRVNKSDFYFIKGIKGESFKTEANKFSIDSFLNDFGAKVIFTEKLQNGVCYYAYSPKISYLRIVNGKKINLQIYMGEMVTVGSPLIYGSF